RGQDRERTRVARRRGCSGPRRRRNGPRHPPRGAGLCGHVGRGSAGGNDRREALRGARGVLRRGDGSGRGRRPRAGGGPPRGRPRRRRPVGGWTGAGGLPEADVKALRVALLLVLFWLVGSPLLLTLAAALGAPHPTLAHFAEFARRPAEWQALWASLWISVATVVLSAAGGVPLAFVFERAGFPGRRLLSALVALPVALPPLVGVVAFLFLYGESGFASRAIQSLFRLEHAPWRLSGPGAILLVHAYSMYVYFYLFIRAGLARLDAAFLEA